MIREIIFPDLAERNSFRVHQRAEKVIEFTSEEDLRAIFASAGAPRRWYVLGGGNNILFTRDYAGVLLSPVARGIEILAEEGSEVILRVEAGVEWDDLVAWAVEHELWGIENLSLIPGTAGAAPVQNIGAYGCEAKEVIEAVEMFRPETRDTLILNKEECAFDYRDSIFKRELRGRVIITAIRIRLSRIPQPRLGYGDLAREVEERGGATLHNIREAVCAIRRAKLPDPAVTGNAGSFFKNPVVDRAVAERLLAEYPDMPHYPGDGPDRYKLAAGWLIDRAGLKGHTEGRVGIHPRQALVLINLGDAEGEEILAFSRKVQAAVRERFGVEIEAEVNIL